MWRTIARRARRAVAATSTCAAATCAATSSTASMTRRAFSVSPPDAPAATPSPSRRWNVDVDDDGGVGLGVALDYDDRARAGTSSASSARPRRDSSYEEYVSSLTPRRANVVITPGDMDGASGRYRVEVTTGRNRGAGTSGRVELTFVGGDGITYPVSLEYENGFSPGFSRGSTLPFRIAASARLGDLKRTRVRLIPELTEVGRGWFLEDIKVTCEATGEQWLFPCHGWFGHSDGGDGKHGPFTQDLESKRPEDLLSPLWVEGQIRKERGEFACAVAGAAVPHMDKMKEGARAVMRRTHGHGGEDAYFSVRGPDNVIGMGIADGVYLWRWQGIDAGEYSRALMSSAADALSSGIMNRPTAMLEHAHKAVTKAGVKGSSTACVVVIETVHGLLYCANVGDSGFMLIRGEPGERYCAHRSPPQEHDFGCPFQLGHHEASDKATDAMMTKLYLEHGDIVVLGSDGLWDNLSEIEIIESIESSVPINAAHGERAMDVAARNLLTTAYEVSMDKSRSTPYSLSATEHFDMVYSGGKQDDISVLVCYAGAAPTPAYNDLSHAAARQA